MPKMTPDERRAEASRQFSAWWETTPVDRQRLATLLAEEVCAVLTIDPETAGRLWHSCVCPPSCPACGSMANDRVHQRQDAQLAGAFLNGLRAHAEVM